MIVLRGYGSNLIATQGYGTVGVPLVVPARRRIFEFETKRRSMIMATSRRTFVKPSVRRGMIFVTKRKAMDTSTRRRVFIKPINRKTFKV